MAAPSATPEREVSSQILHTPSPIDPQKALEAERERYRRLFESDVVGHVITTPDGFVVDCNPAIARMFGFASAEEARGVDIAELYPQDEDRQRILAILREGRRVEGEELALARKDGREIRVVVNVVGVLDADGELREIHAHVIDVTEERRLQRQLSESRKLEAVGRMAEATGQQFDEIVSLIHGCIERILSRPGLDADVAAEAWTIRSAARQGRSLATELLEATGLAVTERHWLDVNAVVKEFLERARELAGPEVRVESELRSVGAVSADPLRIGSVLAELTSNAVEAMEGAGTLTISTAPAEVCETLYGYGDEIPPGAYAVIGVEDTGPGIPESVSERVFDPYFTTRPGRAGLGMARVRGTMGRNGGFVRLEAAAGGGAVVRLYFPAVDAPLDELERPRSSPAVELEGSETILVVDDDEVVRAFLARMLGWFGYAVVQARGGEEALRSIRQSEKPIDLVITDVVMPGVDGIELVNRLRAERPDFPVVVTSGVVRAPDVAGRLPDDVALVPKPFDPRTLVTEVRRALERRRVEAGDGGGPAGA